MSNEQRKEHYLNRRHRIQSKDILLDLVMLLPPSILLSALLFATLFTYGISILLTYFVLPMFYAVDQRTRYQLTGIGKADFSYTDGYKAFFQSNKGGIFGLALSFFAGIGLFLLFSFFAGLLMPYFVQYFPRSQQPFEELMNMYSTARIDQVQFQGFLLEKGYLLSQPLSIDLGIAMFIPLCYVLFYSTDENLTNHYIAEILLPDLDQNISASQTRSVGKTFSRGFTTYRFKESFKMNHPFYLIFTLIYALGLYGVSFLEIPSTNYLASVMAIVPCVTLVFGILLNHFCLINRYIVVEENQDVLLCSIPAPVKTSIYQTYHAKEYVHGEESKARGCFIVPDSYMPQPEEEPYSQPEPQPTEEESTPKGVVIDLSRKSSEKKGDKN